MLSTPPAFVLSQDQTLSLKNYFNAFASTVNLIRAPLYKLRYLELPCLTSFFQALIKKFSMCSDRLESLSFLPPLPKRLFYITKSASRCQHLLYLFFIFFSASFPSPFQVYPGCFFQYRLALFCLFGYILLKVLKRRFKSFAFRPAPGADFHLTTKPFVCQHVFSSHVVPFSFPG